MITTKIIADSLSPAGTRLTTFVCTYPRFIHSEIMTHRDKSRNAASSRAIPVSKMLKLVISEPAMPVYWGQNQSGMQANVELPKSKQWLAKKIWIGASYISVGAAWLMSKLGVHKQITNRLIEPWAHMTVIISGTEWGNFFNLRAHPDAQPEFQELAYRMLVDYKNSEPKVLRSGQWHLPFITDEIHKGYTTKQLLKIVTARCARVSYLNFEGNIDAAKDYALHDRLFEQGHMSPFEHAARAEAEPMMSGNFCGFTQYRKLIPNENRRTFSPELILKGRKQ